MAVFASDERLSEEFGFFVAMHQETAEAEAAAAAAPAAAPVSSQRSRVVTLLGEDDNGEEIQVDATYPTSYILALTVRTFCSIQVEVIDEDADLKILTDEATQQVLESNLLTSPGGTLQIEMSPTGGGGPAEGGGGGARSSSARFEVLAAAVLSEAAEAEAEKAGKGAAAAKRRERLRNMAVAGGHPKR